jgi:hypothetical protein
VRNSGSLSDAAITMALISVFGSASRNFSAISSAASSKGLSRGRLALALSKDSASI